jgi:hypothetical protein
MKPTPPKGLEDKVSDVFTDRRAAVSWNAVDLRRAGGARLLRELFRWTSHDYMPMPRATNIPSTTGGARRRRACMDQQPVHT